MLQVEHLSKTFTLHMLAQKRIQGFADISFPALMLMTCNQRQENAATPDWSVRPGSRSATSEVISSFSDVNFTTC